MVQELISNNSIAIVGAGPAGCICAKFLIDAGFDVTLFDKSDILRTLLPTGGGKCNLSHAEFGFKELAKNYPRGEKFLYSVFSKFSVAETMEFFKSIGVETYIRVDNRIFPVSNSSVDVRKKFLIFLKGVNFVYENVLEISQSSSVGYVIKTNKSTYLFDTVVIATGGKHYNCLSNLDIKIIEPTQALVGLVTEKDYSSLSGVSIKNVKCGKYFGDILFTHKGVSGPLIYTLSSVYARRTFPYDLIFKLIDDVDFQMLLNGNPHKEIKNLLGTLVPKHFGEFLLEELEIPSDLPCHKINASTRDKIYNSLLNYTITIVGKNSDGEVVTCGGVDLNQVNSKTMEHKNYPNLYFCGEILDIDGLCGGFNLQNCWSTGYIAAQSIIEKLTI